MKGSLATTSLLALALAARAVAQGPIQPIFSCNYPQIGGCCERFLPAGDGVGCVEADTLNEGGTLQYTCNDAPTDPGVAACCTIIPNSGPDLIPLPCVQASS